LGEYVHSQSAKFDKSFVSCGVTEVHHLPDQTPTRTVFALANNLYNKANPRPAAFLLFSDITEGAIAGLVGQASRGDKLAAQLRSMKVGELYSSPGTINPKTGNSIRVHLFRINHDAFRKWYQEELANRVEESS
jgi:hypothetical protein